MDRIVFDRMANHDTRHWWYRARRQVLSALIERHARPAAGSRVLEVGCGTGHNLAMLGDFGAMDAVEIDDEARTVAEGRLGHPIGSAPLPELTGVERGAYGLVAALDVVEHVEDEGAALATLGDCLAPGGRLLVTVPAWPWMWSAHDEVNHHHRRYTKRTLRDAIEGAGLTLRRIDWFNSALFLPIAGVRLINRVRGTDDSDDALPSPAVNAAMERVFAAERHLIGRVPMPPGVSLGAIASRD